MMGTLLQTLGVVVIACLIIWAVREFAAQIPPFLVKVVVVVTVVVAVIAVLVLWGAMPSGLHVGD